MRQACFPVLRLRTVGQPAVGRPVAAAVEGWVARIYRRNPIPRLFLRSSRCLRRQSRRNGRVRACGAAARAGKADLGAVSSGQLASHFLALSDSEQRFEENVAGRCCALSLMRPMPWDVTYPPK